MSNLGELVRSLAERPRAVTLFGAPEGYDAAVIGQLVAKGHARRWLHVCRDDGRMARFAAALAFFHPDIEALTFPAWDCLPYDRVSPNGEILSRRIDTLTRLASAGPETPLVVLTTVNALVQRVPPRRLFDGRVLTLRPSGRIGLDRLRSFFRNNGYIRTDTVREPGEFAVRGGIIDLYPAGAPQPLRLDFFGDTIESIRSFDPLTQRSTGAATEANLRPVSEVLLDDAAIRRFRERYREEFGATGTDDPLYQIGQRGTALCRHGALAAALLRAARNLVRLPPQRRDLARPSSGRGSRPPPRRNRRLLRRAAQCHDRRARWFPGLSSAASRAALSRRSGMAQGVARATGCPGLALRRARNRSQPIRCRRPPGRNFAAERADPKVALFEAVRDYLEAERKSGHKPAIAAFSAGSADRLHECCASVASPICVASPMGTRCAAAGLVGRAGDIASRTGVRDRPSRRSRRAGHPRRPAGATPRRRRNLDDFIAEATNLSPGDLVVHVDHGIGRYEGLETHRCRRRAA